ncbi:sensor histidine kinase [Synoicihabitans lomoniglobus]|nr:ATP-binding protein [Opitutaceae bacterium LMO-M01]
MTEPNDAFPFEPAQLGSDMRGLVEALPELRQGAVNYAARDVIVEEGEANENLFILLEGTALLRKSDDHGHLVDVDTFGAGSMLGLTSFWSRTPVFARIEAETDVVCIAIGREVFDRLIARDRRFVQAVQNLFVRNLSDRYRNMISVHMERHQLETALKAERNQLRDTISQLEHMTNRLVNQEKLATMGQLLAGIAHEINNPVGAMLRGVDTAREALERTFAADGACAHEATLLAAGLECPFWSSEEKRNRMDELLSTHSEMGRPLARRLAQLTAPALAVVTPRLKAAAPVLESLLSAYELGVSFRAVNLSAHRIEKIVTSLRNYGRQSSTAWEDADIVQGIQDTLTVLNNRLKRYELHLDLQPVAAFPGNLGEINQVWTNLLVNAMDATPEGGDLFVSTVMDGAHPVVRIADSGTGIAPDKLDRIFNPNYTTKNQSGAFGLGLGLSISRDIVQKHGGTISAANRPAGGACFEVRFAP